MNLWNIADDVMVTMGFTVDDARLNRVAVAYNVKIAVDKVRDQIITKTYQGDIRQAADMLETFVVDVTVNAANTGIPFDCMFFDLPKELYSLPFDGGFAWARYHRLNLPPSCPPDIAGTPFYHASMGEITSLYQSAYESPCQDRPATARDKDRVYVFGVNPLVKKLRVGLYCQLPDFKDIDPNEEVEIPAEYLLTIKKLVIDASRFSLQLPERLQNNGVDPDNGQPLRVERAMSVNDPSNVQQE